jgi:hypothetical protein
MRWLPVACLLAFAAPAQAIVITGSGFITSGNVAPNGTPAAFELRLERDSFAITVGDAGIFDFDSFTDELGLGFTTLREVAARGDAFAAGLRKAMVLEGGGELVKEFECFFSELARSTATFLVEDTGNGDFLTWTADIDWRSHTPAEIAAELNAAAVPEPSPLLAVVVGAALAYGFRPKRL